MQGFSGLACMCAHGLETAACGSAALPRSITLQFRRACKLARRASRLENRRRQHRLVGQAVAALGKAMKLTARAVKHGSILPGCASSLTDLLGDTRGRALSLELTF
jgi:hypothetical protein